MPPNFSEPDLFEIAINTQEREQMVDVTDQVQAEVERSGVGEGLCHLFVPHTTCALTVNEGYDPAVREDLVGHLSETIPHAGEWRHGEGNSDAHVKATLVGPSLTLPVSGGKLRLGRWQAVFFCEFDGPRQRNLWLTVR